ncbi:Scr1 family TA system antitoxin-like transcriptional regulator [Glycomyces halotolerans]
MRWFVAVVLRDARVAAGLTQSEAASAFGYSTGTIYNWERTASHPKPSEVAQIAETYSLSPELKRYLKMILENRDSKLLQADARFHALSLAKAELHSGDIFKHEPHLVPGPLQTRDYHFMVPQAAEQLSEHEAQKGWNFKQSRQLGLRSRKPLPEIRYLVGDSPVYSLRSLPDSVRTEQVRQMLANETLPNTSIRVMTRFHHARNTQFEIFKPGNSDTAPPVFIYSEIFHASWCMEGEALIDRYDGASQAMWQLGIPLKEFLHEHCRDLVAQEHP